MLASAILNAMDSGIDQVTVFRSLDATSEADAIEIREMLADEGIPAVLLSDKDPGVPQGAFEVRVPAADLPRAEELLAENPIEDELTEVDESHELDLETVFAGEEMEAEAVRSLLDANGIGAVLNGDSILPNLGFQVRVAKDKAQEASGIITMARQAGMAEQKAAEAAGEL